MPLISKGVQNEASYKTVRPFLRYPEHCGPSAIILPIGRFDLSNSITSNPDCVLKLALIFFRTTLSLRGINGASKSKNTPFVGKNLTGKVYGIVNNNQIVTG